MSTHVPFAIDFATKFSILVEEQSQWSQETFGNDQERGPIGPLKHLEKEAKEAQDNPTDIMEHADCLLLVLDASRRAGFSPVQLIEAALQKMEINKAREWPKDTPKDTAVEHVRENDNWGVYDIDGAGDEWYLARSEKEAMDTARVLTGHEYFDGEHAERISRNELLRMTYHEDGEPNRTFAEELTRRIADNPEPGLFASSDY